MNNSKLIQWILRVAVAGEFVGHGAFALGGKTQWVGWIKQFTGINVGLAAHILFIIGLMDILLAVIVLIKPIRPLLLWMAIWGFWTALVRPLAGESFWDFVERWSNWGAPLVLFLLTRQRQN